MRRITYWSMPSPEIVLTRQNEKQLGLFVSLKIDFLKIAFTFEICFFAQTYTGSCNEKFASIVI